MRIYFGHAWHGAASHGMAWSGNNATRGDTAGQFLGAERRCTAGHAEARQGLAMRGWAWKGYTLPRAESGTISKAELDMSCHGSAWQGEATTSPWAAITDIFPSTKKHPHHAGQRSTG